MSFLSSAPPTLTTPVVGSSDDAGNAQFRRAGALVVAENAALLTNHHCVHRARTIRGRRLRLRWLRLLLLLLRIVLLVVLRLEVRMLVGCWRIVVRSGGWIVQLHYVAWCNKNNVNDTVNHRSNLSHK